MLQAERASLRRHAISSPENNALVSIISLQAWLVICCFFHCSNKLWLGNEEKSFSLSPGIPKHLLRVEWGHRGSTGAMLLGAIQEDFLWEEAASRTQKGTGIWPDARHITVDGVDTVHALGGLQSVGDQ